ncbi:MAG: hypothetical protein H3C28_13405 [Sphingomonadales bacterium]|nr:hypothetical protein [Sphingomonadales bacterium]
MTPLPSRVVIVHTREHVAATHAAAEKTGVAVMLLSAPHIASAGGPLYAKALMGEATNLVTPVLDCGDDPGICWRAVDVGWTHVLFRGSDTLLEKARSALQPKETSFPRKRESMENTEEENRTGFPIAPHTQLVGNDNGGSSAILTPNDLPSATLDLGQTTRKGEVLTAWIVGWMTGSVG